jgi:hypothetical protein
VRQDRVPPLVGLVGLGGLLAISGCVVAAGSQRGSDWSVFGFFLLPLGLFALLAAMARRSGRRRMETVEPNRALLRAELDVLADDVLRLEPQVALKEEARNDYESAAHRYRVAQAALDQTSDAVDLGRVQRVVDEATWAMARARAIVEGRPPPSPPPPLQRRGPGGEPPVAVDDQDEPSYIGSPASFRSGWFAGGTGLFGGLLLGSVLGGFGSWEVDEGELDQPPDEDRPGQQH